MKKTALLTLLCMSATLPALAQTKFDERLGTSTEVLRQMLARTDAIPRDLLNEARCVMVYPNVKKVGVGLGVTYGRGVLTCRTGPHMQGEWSAPAMYTMDVGSLGVQLGSSSTDFVLLVMSQQGADKVLAGGLKLGADATAIAGPSGARAIGHNDVNADIYTYSRAKGGLFAGTSLGTASMKSDDTANKNIYGRPVDVQQIVRDGAVTTTAAGQPLIDVLEKNIPGREETHKHK
ncbi:lipid-binding SYLF domain-containing protein [Edaphobacter aggregans]|uniref:Lipid-binding SYLF domain-containing protein n=1 Tax=Edaphobacter aggregans TaxID=570835 RepID=A0A428MCN9_9BACT|nr:lipid-binding SYLF domain-containing protein [Edaphobacter aggregans]RSL14644.1 lipid-binding SYLF domain-containing protein [Edaphobacter aggregans]